MATVKVKFLKSHPAFAYFAGDTGDVSAEKAAMLMNGGYVLLLPDYSSDAVPERVNMLPEDFPARDLLMKNGFDTVEKCREAGESLIDIKGIGKKLIAQILAYEVK